MTDKEIVKAFDILQKFDFFHGQRAGRELWNEKPTDVQNEDVRKFSEDVAFLMDFINRQNETIEQLKTALFKCGEDAVEIENYKKIAEYQQGVSMDRFFEIKRLKEEIERLKNLNIKLDEYIIRARAEAVKEFAERLKTNVFEVDDINEDTFLAVEVSHIDYLVKEFTEGKDD